MISCQSPKKGNRKRKISCLTSLRPHSHSKTIKKDQGKHPRKPFSFDCSILDGWPGIQMELLQKEQ